MRNFAKAVLIILFTTVLSAVFIFSALGSKNASQIFQTEFENIKYFTSGGVNYLDTYDERIIAEYGDGYALYNSHRRISNKYKSLRLIDGEAGIYEYTTFNSFIGELSKDGRQITKKNLYGKPINDLVAANSEFYIEYDSSVSAYRAVLLDGTTRTVSSPFSKIFTHSQLNSMLVPAITSTLADGVFTAQVNNVTVIANVFNDTTINYSSIVKIGAKFLLAAAGGGSYDVYSLPQLIKTDTINSTNAFVAENNFAYLLNDTTLRVAGVNDYTVPQGSWALGYSSENNMLFTSKTAASSAFVLSGGNVFVGDYTRVQTLGYTAFKVGNGIFNSQLEPILSGTSLKIMHSNNNVFLMCDSIVYSYDNISTKKLYDSAISTFGETSFLTRTVTTRQGLSVREYELYFNTGTAIFDENSKKLAEHTKSILFAPNLLGSSDTFKDFDGNVTNNVQSYYKMYSASGLATGDYIFKKPDGYHSFEGRIFGVEAIDGEAPIFVKNSKGAVIMVTAKTIAIHDKIFNRADYSFSGIFGNGVILLAKNNTVTTLYPSSKSIAENQIETGVISAAELSVDGAIYSNESGRKGFIDSEGKCRLDALYDVIEVQNAGLVVTLGENKALFNAKGKQLTAFDYQSFLSLGTFTFATRFDGKKHLLNDSGKDALKAVTGSPIFVRNYFSYTNTYVLDYEYSYYFVLSNGKYRLIKCAIEGNNNVYPIWNFGNV